MVETPDSTESIFAAAVALATPGERVALLDRECAGDQALRGRAEALLRAHGRAGHLLDRPVPGSPEETADHIPGEQPGTIIAGRYKLLEAIGEGGMGTVWVAEQTQPVRRKVALKLIKAGMDSKSVLARFEAERQALAVMEHPNIAKVLDGGLTETGRPFFVMEYVKGVPITEYCDATRLSVPERLNLFVQVCQAVQHAHQKGIIHRDLKPFNILVAPYDDKPVPKVIDFGLAKAMHQSLTERTLHTAHETVLGTPLYMSPEQAQFNNLDVDTRSDIYSLGVLLYELLTGTTPLEKQRLKEAAWDEIKRIIREEEAPRPSMRLSSSNTLASLAASRHTEPARLTKHVRGELDWIVMKALDKDRTRRYSTASEFAADITRHLHDEPVLAGPPRVTYRLRKFLHKHRSAVTAAVMVVLALVVGLGASVTLYFQAEEARRATDRARAAEEHKTVELGSALKVKDEALGARNKALNATTIALEEKGLALKRSEALRLAANALLLAKEKPELAGSLAVEAARRSPGPLTYKSLVAALKEMPNTPRVLESPSSAVSSAYLVSWIRFSPDGREVIGMDARGRIHVWETTSGKRLRDFEGAGSETASAVVSPDGRRIAAIDYGGRLHLFDLSTGKKERMIEPESGSFQTVVFSPDGRRLAAASSTDWAEAPPHGRVYVWDLDPFAPTVLTEGKEYFYSVNFSADGKKLAATSLGAPCHVRVWDLQSKQLLLEQEGDNPKTSANQQMWPTAVFTPDGNHVLVDFARDAIRAWGLADGKLQRLSVPSDPGTFNGHMHEQAPAAGLLLTLGLVPSIDGVVGWGGPTQLWDTKRLVLKQTFDNAGNATLSADGRFVATVVEERKIDVWNTSTEAIAARLYGRLSPITALALAPDGKTLATRHKDGVACIWDLEDRGVLPAYPVAIDELAVLDAGNRLALLHYGEGLCLNGQSPLGEGIELLDAYSLRTQKRLAVHQSFKLTSWTPDSSVKFAYSPEMNRYAVQTSNSRVELIDARNGKVLNGFETDFDTHAGESLRFMAGGRCILIHYQSGVVELVDPDSGKSICKINEPVPRPTNRMTFAASPDGRYFLIEVVRRVGEALPLREFHIHDGESGRLQCKLDCEETDRRLVAVAFSPDGRTLATVFDGPVIAPGRLPITENDVVLWNVETGARIAILRGKSSVGVVAFSPDGKRLLSGDGSGMIRIWDVEATKECIAFHAHKTGILSACFSGDGTMIAGPPGPDVVLWNTQTGQEILTLSLAEDPAKLVRFVAGDKALLTVSVSGILRTWPIDPLGHLSQSGFRVRPLTEDEGREFGIAGDAVTQH